MKTQSAVVLAALALCAAHSFALTPAELSGFGLRSGSDPVEYGQLATNQYAKAMSIRFDLVQSGLALTNFPVLVKLSTAISGFSYSDFAKANGGDLRFADANGTLLPHEIDTWNESGVSTVWVKIPRLVKNGTITACYGFTGSGDPAPVDPKDVWDDDYVGVWHLGESALPLKESSETTCDFTRSAKTNQDPSYAAAGVVGGAVEFGAKSGSTLLADDHDLLDGLSSMTVEAWTYQTEFDTSTYRYILTKRKAYNDDMSYYFYESWSPNGATNKTALAFGSSEGKAGKTCWLSGIAPRDSWNYRAVTYAYPSSSGNTAKATFGRYLNGAASGNPTDVDSAATQYAGASALALGGGYQSGGGEFNGSIDEVRISKVARSAAWIKATYDTIVSSGFASYAIGTELPPIVDPTNILLKATTDKANPIDYVEGEPIRFDFRIDGVEFLPAELNPAYVVWERTGDDGVKEKGTNAISPTNGFSITTSLATNGIVRIEAYLAGPDKKKFSYIGADGKSANITFSGGAGVATEKMKLSTVEPADFDQFWREAKQKLAAVPYGESDVELTEVFPSSATNTHRFFAVKIPCIGPRPVTGWLTVPKKPQTGGVPIRAIFEGYGCIKKAPNPPTANSGQQVRLQVNAHGYDLLGHDDQYYQDFYDSLYPSGRKSYGLEPSDYDNPTNTYFYYMAMRVVRAFDYLKTRPEWDGKTIIAEGGSQGGLQTMWAGGLVDGITQIKPGITWGCDIGDPFPYSTGPLLTRGWGIPCVQGAFYFDSVLHAKRVPRDCVASITRLGMGDYTCPPRGVLLSYYNMKCKVSAYLVQGSTHSYTPPSPNQTCTISKEMEPEQPEPPAPSSVFASDMPGFDWTNRVVTVTNATAGSELTLTATASDGTTVTATATVDANGEATFDVRTAPGMAYTYTVAQAGAAVASGTFSAGSWKAAGTWFSGAVQNGEGVVSGGNWVGEPTVAEGGNALTGDASFALDADAVEIGSNRLVRVDFDIENARLCLEGELKREDGAMFGGIAAAACTAGETAWFAYDGLAWNRLYGDNSPAEDTAYIVRAELDLAKGEKGAIRYYVSGNHGASFAPLFTDEGSASPWIECNAADSRAVKSVSAKGKVTVASVGGSLMGADVAEADGVGYESLADAIAAATNSLALLTNVTWPTDTPVGSVAIDRGGFELQGVTIDASGNAVVENGYTYIPGEGKVNISLTQAAALGVDTTGKSPAQIASALAANGANGIPLWKSYALGLDPTDATAKPKASIVIDGDKIDIELVGITVSEDSGATVTYKVFKSAELSTMAAAEQVGEEKTAGTPLVIDRDSSAPKMFYQLKVDVKGY